jgi:hypothetical protein
VLVDFLRTNADIFAWSLSDMPGIPREVTEHALEIWAIKEVHHPEWLANPILVKKKSGK